MEKYVKHFKNSLETSGFMQATNKGKKGEILVFLVNSPFFLNKAYYLKINSWKLSAFRSMTCHTAVATY